MTVHSPYLIINTAMNCKSFPWIWLLNLFLKKDIVINISNSLLFDYYSGMHSLLYKSARKQRSRKTSSIQLKTLILKLTSFNVAPEDCWEHKVFLHIKSTMITWIVFCNPFKVRVSEVLPQYVPSKCCSLQLDARDFNLKYAYWQLRCIWPLKGSVPSNLLIHCM